MLPSMPIISSSSMQSSSAHNEDISEKDQNKNDALKSENEDVIKNARNLTSNEIPPTLDYFSKDEKECDDELVLLADSSPLSEKRKLLAQVSQPKKKKKIDSNHLEIFVEERSIDDHADHLAEAYFNKAKSLLDETTFQKFIALLSESEDLPGSAVALYKRIVELLGDYPDLVDDFVGFLHPHQAQECGKFIDYKYFEKCWNFLRKLEVHHMNRFIHTVEQQIANCPSSPDTLKSTLLPTFKGQQQLSDGFLQLLPDEKPPPSSKEDYEDISETSVEDGNWERLRIAEHPERGFCQNCACKCHTAPSHPFCISCNIKFINGQIYVQHGKVLRFARVTFGDVPQMEMLKKLHPALYSKRRKEKKVSTAKTLTIENKESGGDQEEILLREIKCEPDDDDVCNDAVAIDDGIAIIDIGSGAEERQDEEDDYWGEESSGGEKSLDSEITSDPDTCDSTRIIGMVTPVSPLANTQDCCSDTNLVNKEVQSSEHKSTDSINNLNEFEKEIKCEKESNEIKEKPNEMIKEWTREEDKLILQAFQKEIGTEQTFSKISTHMPSRSMDDIQARFKVLMSLLEKMASGTEDSCKK